MPETRNGYTNGNGNHTYEMEDNASFLFTSESVGEGHPGKLLTRNDSNTSPINFSSQWTWEVKNQNEYFSTIISQSSCKEH